MEDENSIPDLDDFPHTFQLNIGGRKAPLIRVQRQEEAALEAGQYKTPFDIARVHNFLAFILCSLSRGPQALEHVDIVLEKQDKNITALANKVQILCCLGEFRKAKKVYKFLKSLRQDENFEYLKVLAKAELAECYGRSGRHVNRQAIELFREVIPAGREPEVWSWRYGLAIMYRQAAGLQFALHATPDLATYPSKSLCQLKKVIKGTADDTLKAKAYTEIAWLIFTTLDSTTKCRLKQEARISLIDACTKAVDLDDTNTSVLRKAARIFRYAKTDEHLNRAADLLLRAIQIHESSAIHHDLGLTYKAIALRSKKASLREEALKERKRPAFRKHLRGKRKWKQRKPPKRTWHIPQYAVPLSSNAAESAVFAKLCKMIKSPPVGAMLMLRPGNEYVADAVYHMRRAVEFSEGENTRATYDLALMFEALDDTDEALQLYDSICRRAVLLDQDASAAPLDIIAAYERYGLILLSERRREEDNAKKKEMFAEAMQRLQRSLQIAATVYPRTTFLGKYSSNLWKSVAILLKAIENSRKKKTEKLKETIQLFKLIGERKTRQQLLKMLTKRAEEEKDVEGLKLCIDNYKEERLYHSAVPLLSVLLCAMPTEERLRYLEEGRAQEIYIEAARKQLKMADRSHEPCYLKSLFDIIFAPGSSSTAGASSDTFDGSPERAENPSQEMAEPSEDRDLDVQSDTESSGGEDSFEDESFADSEYESDGPGGWDVMLLHDSKAERRALKLEEILREICRLSVTCMEEDVIPGHLKLNGVVNNMIQSRVVIILLSGHADSFQDPELQTYFDHAAKKRNKFVLRIKDQCIVPTVLKALPSTYCPHALWRINMTDDVQEGQGPSNEEGFSSRDPNADDAGADNEENLSPAETSADEAGANREETPPPDDAYGEGVSANNVESHSSGDPDQETDAASTAAGSLDQTSADALCRLFRFLTTMGPARPSAGCARTTGPRPSS